MVASSRYPFLLLALTGDCSTRWCMYPVAYLLLLKVYPECHRHRNFFFKKHCAVRAYLRAHAVQGTGLVLCVLDGDNLAAAPDVTLTRWLHGSEDVVKSSPPILGRPPSLFHRWKSPVHPPLALHHAPLPRQGTISDYYPRSCTSANGTTRSWRETILSATRPLPMHSWRAGQAIRRKCQWFKRDSNLRVAGALSTYQGRTEGSTTHSCRF